MASAAKRLEILEGELLALDDEAMLLSELDGFLAGVIACPEPIAAEEWLPAVWGEDGDDGEGTGFESEEHFEDVLRAVMAHYRSVADPTRTSRSSISTT
jgi:uncharacterized protein